MFKDYDMSEPFTGLVEFLKDMGYNTKEDLLNFKGTDKRAEKAFKEMVLPKDRIYKLIKKYLSTTFPTKDSDRSMVVQTNITAISMCPHHLLPISMRVSAGYIPQFKVLGLSKIVRVVQTLAKQPILQEDYTYAVAKFLYSDLASSGSAAHVQAVHGCMYCRGVRSDTKTITTSLLGWFREEQKVKEEFLSYVHNVK